MSSTFPRRLSPRPCLNARYAPIARPLKQHGVPIGSRRDNLRDAARPSSRRLRPAVPVFSQDNHLRYRKRHSHTPVWRFEVPTFGFSGRRNGPDAGSAHPDTASLSAFLVTPLDISRLTMPFRLFRSSPTQIATRKLFSPAARDACRRVMGKARTDGVSLTVFARDVNVNSTRAPRPAHLVKHS